MPRAAGEIPHYVDSNPDLGQYAAQHHLPWVAVQGGAATQYPEFAEVMRRNPATSPEDGE